MNKEMILEYISEDIVDKAKFYSYECLPSQISNALYLYGNTSDYQVLGFIDASEQLDGSLGMIFTDLSIYFCFKNPQVIAYKDIKELMLVKNEDNSFYAKIKTINSTYVFKNSYLNLVNFIMFLSDILELKISYVMSDFEKVEYFIPMIINDIKNDNYEDLELSSIQLQQLKDIENELAMLKNLDEIDYQDECRSICKYCLDYFDSLGLDSDEIDILKEVQHNFDQKDDEQEQQIAGAKKWVDDMMNSYRQGDTKMYDQMKSVMDNLGIDENKLNNMSQEELDKYVQDMCKKFGISQSMFNKIKDRFSR